MEAKLQRQQINADARRALVLDAARAVFADAGIDGASIREIAKQAGYTPGAIYSYFESKEAIYGALLGESLERLNVAVAQAKAFKSRPDRTLESRARAWFGFYLKHPKDLDLGFYLVKGLQPRGLTPELNTHLNARLLDALRPCESALLEFGLAPNDARRESTALFAHGVGLLLLAHTGRIRIFGQSAQTLFDSYLADLVCRCQAALDGGLSGQPGDANSNQADLFS